MRLAALILVALLSPSAVEATSRFLRPSVGEPIIGAVTTEIEVDGLADRVDLWLDDRLVGTLRHAPWVFNFDAGFSSDERRLRAVIWRAGMAARDTIEQTSTALSVGATIDVNLVEVPVRLRSEREPTAASLRILESGRPQTILELRPARGPTRFVVVLDRSLSMREGKLPHALEAVEWLRSELGPHDTLELIFFNHTVSPPLQVQPVRTPIAAPPASGGTALFDALASVRTRERDVVILISDTEDRHSRAGERAVRDHLTSRSVTFYSVALSAGNAAAALASTAEATGGMALRTRDPRAGVAEVIRDVNGQQIAVYQSTSASAGWRPIEVRSLDRAVRVLASRKGYTAR